jgi:hypothetical protein
MPCPTCSEDGEMFRGPRRAEQDHFLRRVLWDLHRLRLAVASKDTGPLEGMVSQIIRDVETLAEMMQQHRT